MPRVSVVIPTYNRADLISETIDSVINQTYRNYEIIVVDDGSTDDTPAILGRYGKHIRVIRQENQGEGEARNTGIRAAQGEYVAFLDSDDLWRPAKLEKQMDLLARSPQVAWVYCDAYVFESKTGKIMRLISKGNHPYEGQVAGRLLTCNFIPSPTPMIRRSVFDEMGFFNKSLIGVDWDMWLRIATRYPIRRAPEVLAGYRIHQGSVFADQNRMQLHKGYIDTIENAISFAPEIYEPFRNQALSALCVRTGRVLAGTGQVKMARSMFIEAIKYKWSGKACAYLVSCMIGQTSLRAIIAWRRRLRQWRANGQIRQHGLDKGVL